MKSIMIVAVMKAAATMNTMREMFESSPELGVAIICNKNVNTNN